MEAWVLKKGAINGVGTRSVISNTKKTAMCFALLRLIPMYAIIEHVASGTPNRNGNFDTSIPTYK